MDDIISNVTLFWQKLFISVLFNINWNNNLRRRSMSEVSHCCFENILSNMDPLGFHFLYSPDHVFPIRRTASVSGLRSAQGRWLLRRRGGKR